VLVDDPPEEAQQPWCLWRHFVISLKVQRYRAQGSNHTNGTAVPNLVGQLADMARVHLAARPFMRYSIHLSHCGAVFNLAIFGRAGGVLSKDYNINDDLEIFIRIIRRLGRDLDVYGRGLNGLLCRFTTRHLEAVPRVSRPGWGVDVYHTGAAAVAAN
jgi:hypothetical protein